jgi:hypothetical protein
VQGSSPLSLLRLAGPVTSTFLPARGHETGTVQCLHPEPHLNQGLLRCSELDRPGYATSSSLLTLAEPLTFVG